MNALWEQLTDQPIYWQIILYIALVLGAILVTAIGGRLVMRWLRKESENPQGSRQVGSILITGSPNPTINMGNSATTITAHNQPSQEETQMADGQPTRGISRQHEYETVRMSELARDDIIIRNRRFDHCTILGPAVIALLRDVNMSNITIGVQNSDIETVLIEIPDGKYQIGIIGLENCNITSCSFEKIAFIGTRDSLDMIRNALRG